MYKTEKSIISILESRNIIKRGHFLLTSGQHSDTYINKNLITYYPDIFKTICDKMYQLALNIPYCDIITGPATAGSIFATAISVEENIPLVYPDKLESKYMIFQRGYDKLMKGKNILLVEDIITTGGSIEKTVKAVEDVGGNIIGIIAIWNRTGYNHQIYPVKSIINKKIDSWLPEECPLCLNNISLTDPKKF